ncbi:MAG: hypothetical protein HY365_03515 [Candidatus Aenigmarchaeota archaeon]|nr:hypothetical protein [Candidatus Aenigmarchaeota archaeon]
MNPLLIIPASLVLGSLVYYLIGGPPLLYLFLLVWLDKTILRSITPEFLGIEVTTLATVLAGMALGGMGGFVFAIITIPLLEGIKGLIVPGNDVPFLPTPYHLADAIVAFLASFLAGVPLLGAVAALLAVKFMMDATIDAHFTAKPFDFLSAGLTVVFNLLMVWGFGAQLTAAIL